MRVSLCLAFAAFAAAQPAPLLQQVEGAAEGAVTAAAVDSGAEGDTPFLCRRKKAKLSDDFRW